MLSFLSLSLSIQCAKLSLILVGPQLPKKIRALASYRELTFVAYGNEIAVFNRAHQEATWSGHKAKIQSLLVFGDNILSVDVKGNLFIWAFKGIDRSVAPIGHIVLERNFTPSCMVHPDTYLNKVLFGSHEGSLQLWNVSTQKKLYEFKGWKSSISCCVSSPALDVIAVGCADGSIHVHNIRYDEPVVTFSHSTRGAVTALSFSTGQALDSPTTVSGEGRNPMPNLWLRWLQLKPFASSSSSATPTHSHIARLILDQKSASEALRTFRWASDLPDYRHSQSTYRALIHKLCTFRRFDTVKEVLEEMPQRLGAPPDDDTFVTLVRGLARAGMLRRVLKVPNMVVKFRGGTAPSLKILNSVLNVLVKENIDVARDFFRNHMMASGVGGDDYTFGILMKGLCSTNRIADAFKLLQLIKSRGTIPNAVVYNTLLHALCRNGSVGRARSLLSEIDEPSDVTFNILVSAYCGEGNLIQALVLLDKCLNLGLLPDIITVTKVLELLCQSERVSEAVEILERVESKGVSVDVQAYNTVIKGFCRLGKPKVGRRILKEMEKKGRLPNADSYNVLISGFCNAGMCESAVDLFEEMKTDGIEWSFETYNALIRGLCSRGRTGDGFRILQLMEESRDGCRGQISPYNSVLYGLYRENRIEEGLEFLKNMEALFPEVVNKSFEILELCKERKNKDAKSVYDEMSGKDIAPSAFVYSRLITGLCGDGCLREALELTNEMIIRGFTPIASTLNSVIEGFCQHGRADTGIRFIEDMAARGCVFDSQSYGLLLHWFCEDGRSVEKARKLLSEMVDKSIIPDYSSWSSMLLCLSQQTEWSATNNDLNDLVNIMETCQEIKVV